MPKEWPSSTSNEYIGSDIPQRQLYQIKDPNSYHPSGMNSAELSELRLSYQLHITRKLMTKPK